MAAGDGVVFLLLGTEVDDGCVVFWLASLFLDAVPPRCLHDIRTVDVSGTTSVMAWHKTVEDSYTVVVGGLNSAKGSSLQDRGIVGVAHSRVALDTDVHALKRSQSVMPNLHQRDFHHVSLP